MQAMEATTAPTKVIYGVNELDLDLAGKSIRGIWKVLEQVLNIPRDAAVSVNGDRVQDDYVVRPGDEIEFQKQAGVKGLRGLTPANADVPEPARHARRLRAPAAERSPNAMQSRTFLRIEGDLVSLVTEVIDREVTLPDLLTELTTAQVAMTPRLPTGCRFWIRSGTTDRSVFVVEQPPSRRTIEYHASRRRDSEPTTYRLAVPYVVFVVSTIGEQIEGLSTYFRTQPIASLDATLFCSTLPNTNDDGIVCLGSVRVSGASVGERVDALIGAFWASRFNQDLRRHPLPFSGGFRAWASRSRRDPLAALSLQYDPYWRTLRQVVAQMAGLAITDLPAGTPAPGRTDGGRGPDPGPRRRR